MTIQHPAFARARRLSAAGRKAAGITRRPGGGYQFKNKRHGFNSSTGADMIKVATIASELNAIRVYRDKRTAKRLGYTTSLLFFDKTNGPKKLRAWAAKYARLGTRERAALRQYYLSTKLCSDYNPLFRRIGLRTVLTPPRRS